MKTNETNYKPSPAWAICAAALALSPCLLSQASPDPLCLTSECASNKFTLRWSGALGVKLQQTTNLANPHWQDVPWSEAASRCELPMTNTRAFFRLVDLGLDVDRDNLYDALETTGWTIFVDTSGYGDPTMVEARHVTSDPRLTDTDGDGIDDYWEWLLGTDPRSADTDGDGLTDYEEWFKWHTSPTSVDTDGDARGPNHDLPPKAQLFDGNELHLLHTSPTLEDTDGDGRTDYEEYDALGRDPLVAQLPKLDVEIVDAVDIRLDVQYAEEAGKSREYGGELTTSTSTTDTTSSSHSVNASLKIGGESTVGFFKAEAKMTTEFTLGWQGTWTSEKSTSQGTENSYSDYTTDSRTRTETAASGSMSAGIRLVNNGPITYLLTDFGLTVRYWVPGATGGTNGSFKTLATLVPSLGANGITLAPGDSTPVLQVQATGLNASAVKEFIARPNSLQLEPAFYEMENAEGLNFDYLEEVTRWRTARVEIDYGTGTNEEYRVATNVERNEDGTYAGITMGTVLSNLLHVPFQTVPIRTLKPTNASNERVLYSVRNTSTVSTTNGFWIVVWSGGGIQPAHPNFDEIVLQAGDQILLTYMRDADGDGLFGPEEQHFGTYDSVALGDQARDSDSDGLSDAFEARTGWDVIVLNHTNHVYSDPRQPDQDHDGLTDAQEYAKRTDPTKADTDEDGIPDNLDVYPLNPAKVLRVTADAVHGGNSATNGATWDTALTNLQDALTFARAGLATTNVFTDDVAEIWVAAGVYKPTTTTTNRNARFELVNNTSVYGGFTGVETKLSQREPDPLLNGTVLSGDLLGNDASTPWDDASTYNDNSVQGVCFAATNIGSGTVLDGFTITGGNSLTGGGMLCSGHPNLRNLFFRANFAWGGGGLCVLPQTASAEPFVVSDCLFLQNAANVGGGVILEGITNTQVFIVTNCQFYQNLAPEPTSSGGGGLAVAIGKAYLQNCTFAWNVSAAPGGGMVILRPATVRIERCEFFENTATNGGGGFTMDDAGGTAASGDLKVEVVQSILQANRSLTYGGAFWAKGNITNKRLYILNSCVVSNTASSGGAAFNLDYGGGWIENSILWGNAIRLYPASSTLTVRTTCLAEAANYPGNGNFNADPKFVDSFGGNFRLQSGSPCVDAGNNYMDYYQTVPGFQSLPATDMDGNRRIADGNNDGNALVDMGAYERQGQ